MRNSRVRFSYSVEFCIGKLSICVYGKYYNNKTVPVGLLGGHLPESGDLGSA